MKKQTREPNVFDSLRTIDVSGSGDLVHRTKALKFRERIVTKVGNETWIDDDEQYAMRTVERTY